MSSSTAGPLHQNSLSNIHNFSTNTTIMTIIEESIGTLIIPNLNDIIITDKDNNLLYDLICNNPSLSANAITAHTHSFTTSTTLSTTPMAFGTTPKAGSTQYKFSTPSLRKPSSLLTSPSVAASGTPSATLSSSQCELICYFLTFVYDISPHCLPLQHSGYIPSHHPNKKDNKQFAQQQQVKSWMNVLKVINFNNYCTTKMILSSFMSIVYNHSVNMNVIKFFNTIAPTIGGSSATNLPSSAVLNQTNGINSKDRNFIVFFLFRYYFPHINLKNTPIVTITLNDSIKNAPYPHENDILVESPVISSLSQFFTTNTNYSSLNNPVQHENDGQVQYYPLFDTNIFYNAIKYHNNNVIKLMLNGYCNAFKTLPFCLDSDGGMYVATQIRLKKTILQDFTDSTNHIAFPNNTTISDGLNEISCAYEQANLNLNELKGTNDYSGHSSYDEFGFLEPSPIPETMDHFINDDNGDNKGNEQINEDKFHVCSSQIDEKRDSNTVFIDSEVSNIPNHLNLSILPKTTTSTPTSPQQTASSPSSRIPAASPQQKIIQYQLYNECDVVDVIKLTIDSYNTEFFELLRTMIKIHNIIGISGIPLSPSTLLDYITLNYLHNPENESHSNIDLENCHDDDFTDYFGDNDEAILRMVSPRFPIPLMSSSISLSSSISIEKKDFPPQFTHSEKYFSFFHHLSLHDLETLIKDTQLQHHDDDPIIIDITATKLAFLNQLIEWRKCANFTDKYY